jgi:hypothetical protein
MHVYGMWPWKVPKWPWFWAEVAVKALRDLAAPTPLSNPEFSCPAIWALGPHRRTHQPRGNLGSAPPFTGPTLQDAKTPT